MKKKFTEKVLLLGLISLGLFSSCSKQITSIGRNDKLVSQQSFSGNQIKQNEKMVLSKPETNPTLAIVSENTANPIMIANQKTAIPLKDQAKTFIKNLPKLASNEIKQKVAIIGNMATNHHTASYNSNQQTEGMLGIAGICLIGAIALAVFGLVNTAALFWYLAAVLLIAAIVFFLLYLLAKVAQYPIVKFSTRIILKAIYII